MARAVCMDTHTWEVIKGEGDEEEGKKWAPGEG
jgi:hypothetical protein